MEQRTIDDGELRQWIDEWGEESHDDILASDDEADIANRILEHHTHGEYPDDVDWNDAWESLRSIIEPALEHVHGFFPDGAETLARYVREIDMGIDPDTGEDLERAAIEEPAFRTSFRIRAMADADPEDEPALDKVIQAADADYRHDVISGGDVARADWRNAAAYEWRRLMLEPHAPTDPVSDVSALAVIAVSMRYAPDATDVLGPDLPTMGGLRDIIGTPERDVPVDTLITDLVGQWPDATPDRDTLIDRDHAAWRILSPIQQNAPAPVEGHIYGLLGMMKFLDDEGREGTGVGRKAVLRAHAPRPSMSGAECSCGERFATWEEYGRHVDGLVSTPPETREEAIENALADHLGDPYGRGDWDGRLEPSVGDHGLFHCGCGWKSSVPDIGEWRRHMADAILAELAEVRERG